MAEVSEKLLAQFVRNLETKVLSQPSEVGAAAARGAVVIDNSSYWRTDADVPLVVPEVNADAVAGYTKKGIIANPNCSTMQMVVALKPLYDAAGIERLVIVPCSIDTAPEDLDRSNRLLAELAGRTTGYCGGNGGSMHIADIHNGNLGANGIVGAGTPLGVGAALAAQMGYGRDFPTDARFGVRPVSRVPSSGSLLRVPNVSTGAAAAAGEIGCWES